MRTASPAIPSRITVGPTSYRVIVSERRSHDADIRFGFTEYASAQIVVHPDQATGQMRDTLLHETLHAVFFALGFSKGKDPLVPDDVVEPVVHALATSLLDTLRRNPRLVAYLLAP